MSLHLKSDGAGVEFTALVRPRSSRNQIAGVHGGALKIHLTAPPVDGAANKACIKFVARALGVRPAQVSLVSGLTGRNKTLRVEGLSAQQFNEKLAALIPPGGKEPA